MSVVTDKRWWNWKAWPHFTPDEFACQHCGDLLVSELMLDRLELIRERINANLFYDPPRPDKKVNRRREIPIKINSGYRCSEHPIEKAKKAPSAHSYGVAVDIAINIAGVNTDELFDEIKMAALYKNVLGIGDGRIYERVEHINPFIHLDWWTERFSIKARVESRGGRLELPMRWDYIKKNGREK